VLMTNVDDYVDHCGVDVRRTAMLIVLMTALACVGDYNCACDARR
jgi:hypothetical protein